MLLQQVYERLLPAVAKEDLLVRAGPTGPGFVEGDAIALLRKVPAASVHLVLSDIPYGIGADAWDVLHDNTNSALLGRSPAQERAGAVFKRRGKPINGWSEADGEIPREYYAWCARWAGEIVRVLKPGGSAILFAGRRFAPRCVTALEDAGLNFRDMLAWMRRGAVHRAQRLGIVFARRGDHRRAEEWEGFRLGNLRPTFEPIIWCQKPYKITIADNVIEHEVGAFNQEAFVRWTGGVDNVISCGLEPGEGGLHPTQKPVKLMKALVELCTREGQLVLDPFAGSGSTLVAARELSRRYLGFELSPEYARVIAARLQA